MRTGQKIRKFFTAYSYGTWAIASLLACCATGIVLALPYNVSQPFQSIRFLLLSSPYAVLFRNIHYWSAQFFLILIILHTWEYLRDRSTIRSKGGRWSRLCISLPVTFLVMLTGFILKADADSVQARQILDALIRKIPLAGKWVSYLILGQEGNYQMVYVHHIATGTLFLFIVLFEHARTIWGKWQPFLATLIALMLFGYLFQAPLHDGLNPVVKGPWYFTGFQEILYWLKNPGLSLIIILALLLLVFYLPVLRPAWYSAGKKLLLAVFYTYLCLTIIGYFFRGENWKWTWPWERGFSERIHIPFLPEPIPFSYTGEAQLAAFSRGQMKTESCLICHQAMTGFSPSHDPSAIGCVCCHGGNPGMTTKRQAHRGMILVPGNLYDASLTCGNTGCHPDIPSRVKQSLMTSMSGVVSVNRFVFDEQPVPSQLSHISDIGYSPADRHLRNLCANCHLGNKKSVPGPLTQLSRGGGCTACHIGYSANGLEQHKKYREEKKRFPDGPVYHPSLSINVTDDHCFGCHSRSGRISLSYAGMHETFPEPDDLTDTTIYQLLDDKRVVQFVQADIHQRMGMACIDCHHAKELMGDGKFYRHKEEQTCIRCTDCHVTAAVETIPFENLDSEQQKILTLRHPKGYTKDILRGPSSGEAMTQLTRDEEGNILFRGKNSGISYFVKPPADVCVNMNSHPRLDCSSCHSGWAPRCIGCHNTYNRNEPGYDLLLNREVRGSWVEHAGKFMHLPPTLGVRMSGADSTSTIRPAVPGMILSIDRKNISRNSERAPLFSRLYASLEPHTTMAEGRSCASCHLDPVCLGYGEGKLEYIISGTTGRWLFTPRYQIRDEDGLPEDAWIGFLQLPAGKISTRLNFRPFNPEEQKKILTVGACLTCHDEQSMIIRRSLYEFDKLLPAVSKHCILPEWR